MIGIDQGAGPQLLEGTGSGSGSATSPTIEIYATPLLDLTRTYANIEIVPARPGYFPLMTLGAAVRLWVVESVTGVQTVPCQFNAGNNAAHNNFFNNETTDPSNADINAMIASGFPNAASGPLFAAAAQVLRKMFTGLPIMFDLTSPAVGTGGFTCSARLVFPVAWFPLGDT